VDHVEDICTASEQIQQTEERGGTDLLSYLGLLDSLIETTAEVTGEDRERVTGGRYLGGGLPDAVNEGEGLCGNLVGVQRASGAGGPWVVSGIRPDALHLARGAQTAGVSELLSHPLPRLLLESSLSRHILTLRLARERV
jgi:hypothetical protein